VGLEIDCTPFSTCADTAEVNTGYVWSHCKYSATSIFISEGTIQNEYKIKEMKIYVATEIKWGPLMVAQWLRCCATNWKVTGSIPGGVLGIFHRHNPSDRIWPWGRLSL
jgi:hypothetical protein